MNEEKPKVKDSTSNAIVFMAVILVMILVGIPAIFAIIRHANGL